ncbi:MAG: DUF1565 domain-containing protein [Chloroflexi bacterium]|nr:DUF1565 domain-containing protein [Chloroflexota bacterium]
MKKYGILSMVITFLVLALLSASCGGGGGSSGSALDSNSLTLNLASRDGGRSFPPGTYYFMVQVLDTSGAVIDEKRVDLPDTSTTFDDVPSGDINVKVGAYDESGCQVGYGMAAVVVHDGYNSAAQIFISSQPPVWALLMPSASYDGTSIYNRQSEYSLSVVCNIFSPNTLQADSCSVTRDGTNYPMEDLGPGGETTIVNYFYSYPPVNAGYRQLEGRGTGSFFETRLSLSENQIPGTYNFIYGESSTDITYNGTTPRLPVIQSPSPDDTVDFGSDVTVTWEDLGPDYGYMCEASWSSSPGTDIIRWSSVDQIEMSFQYPEDMVNFILNLPDNNSAVIPAGIFNGDYSHDVIISVIAFDKSQVSAQSRQSAIENPFLDVGKLVIPIGQYIIKVNPSTSYLTPYISGVTPASAKIGDEITLTGGRFGSIQGSNTVTVGGVASGPATSWSDTMVSVIIPAGAYYSTITASAVFAHVNNMTSNLKGVYIPVTYYVNAGSGDDSNDGSFSLPFKTITHAMTVAQNGQTVIVSEGIYNAALGETFPILVTDGTTMRGGYKNDYSAWNMTAYLSILDAESAERVVRCNSLTYVTELNGLTIINGNTTSGGGGIYCYRSDYVNILNCQLFNNNGKGGGGVYLYQSDAGVVNCLFANNTAGTDGGGAIRVYQSTPAMSNCTVAFNSSTSNGGGILFSSSSPGVDNFIITDNTASGSGGGIYSTGGTPTITFSDIFNNTPDNYSGITPGVGCISGDPLYVNAAAANFHLLSGSPCIDTGHPNYLGPLNKGRWETQVGIPDTGIVDMGFHYLYVAP